MENRLRKKRTFPHTIIVMMITVAIFAILTWIIPAGMYDTEVIDGKTRYIAGSYHLVERSGQDIWEMMMCFAQGFTKNAGIFFMIFAAGGAVHMLEQTGCLDVIFRKVAKLPTKATPLIIGLVMLCMSLVGSTGAFSNPIVALMPIGIMLAGALGYDKTVGFILVYFGAYSGFNVGATNVFTVGIAQAIAELPAFSGMNVRILCHAISFITFYAFALLYIKKLRKNPQNSLNYEPGMEVSEYMGVTVDGGEEKKLTTTQLLSFIGFLIFVVAIVVGSLKANWTNTHFTAAFILLAIYLAIVNRIAPNAAVKQFAKGCSTMTMAGLVIGFAGSLPTILEAGKIMHTIVYWLSIPIGMVGSSIGAVLMFVANLIINFFIPSGSGQAAAVMPIMVPIADMCGITRQVAVQAYQFGDGLSNIIVPTGGTLMGCLGIAGIDYGKYAKWIIPLLVLQCVLAAIAVFILQSIGWMG